MCTWIIQVIKTNIYLDFPIYKFFHPFALLNIFKDHPSYSLIFLLFQVVNLISKLFSLNNTFLNQIPSLWETFLLVISSYSLLILIFIGCIVLYLPIGLLSSYFNRYIPFIYTYLFIDQIIKQRALLTTDELIIFSAHLYLLFVVIFQLHYSAIFYSKMLKSNIYLIICLFRFTLITVELNVFYYLFLFFASPCTSYSYDQVIYILPNIFIDTILAISFFLINKYEEFVVLIYNIDVFPIRLLLPNDPIHKINASVKSIRNEDLFHTKPFMVYNKMIAFTFALSYVSYLSLLHYNYAIFYISGIWFLLISYVYIERKFPKILCYQFYSSLLFQKKIFFV